jgi:hypothetical protein
MTEEALPTLLRPEPAYRNVLRLRAAATWGPLLIGAIVADRLLLADRPFAWARRWWARSPC